MRKFIHLAALGLTLCSTARASVLDRPFYAGKQITIITDSTAGAYEAYARAVATYLPKYIPGNPSIIVEVKPDAGGVVAADYLYNIAPKDGTVIGGLHGNILTASLLEPSLTKYDPTKFSWLANFTKDTYVGYVMANTGITSLDDAKTKQIILGGTAPGGAGIDLAVIAKSLFGFKFKIVSGYGSSADVELALSRGELQGTFAHALSALRLQKSDWIKEEKVRFIVQQGLTRDPTIPDVPLLMDFATTELQRQVLKIETVRQTVSKPYLAPPGVPTDRLAVLRNAVQSVQKDPGFLGLIHTEKLDLNEPLNAQQLSDLERDVMKSSPDAVQTLKKILSGE
jgi:tripartite-type tricarboxylate transporter receptor subunit TctC